MAVLTKYATGQDISRGNLSFSNPGNISAADDVVTTSGTVARRTVGDAYWSLPQFTELGENDTVNSITVEVRYRSNVAAGTAVRFQSYIGTATRTGAYVKANSVADPLALTTVSYTPSMTVADLRAGNHTTRTEFTPDDADASYSLDFIRCTVDYAATSVAHTREVTDPVGLADLRLVEAAASTTAVVADTVGVTDSADAVVTSAPATAPTIRSVARGHGVNTATVPAPAGVAEGDLLLAFLQGDTGTVTITGVPTGYTLITDTISDGGSTMTVYRKVAGAAEGETTWTVSADELVVHIVCVQDADTTTAVQQVTATHAAATSYTLPGITPAAADTLLLAWIAVDGSAPVGAMDITWSSAEGYVEAFDYSETGSVTTERNMWFGGATQTAAGTSAVAGPTATFTNGSGAETGISGVFGVAPGAAAGGDKTRTHTDTAGLTDSATTVATSAREATDPVGIADSAAAGLTVPVALTDPVGLSDTAEAVKSQTREVTDPVGLADNVTTSRGLALTLTSPVGAADSTDRQHAATRTLTDPVGTTDPVQVGTAGVEDITLTDPVGTTDSTAPALTATRDHTDDLALTGQATATRDLTVTVTDPLGAADNASTEAAATVTATITDPIGAADSTTTSTAQSHTIGDSVNVSDQPATATTATRTLTDPVGTTDPLDAGQALHALITDPIGATDSTLAGRGLTHTVTDGLPVADLTAATATLVQEVTDLLDLASSLTQGGTATPVGGATTRAADGPRWRSHATHSPTATTTPSHGTRWATSSGHSGPGSAPAHAGTALTTMGAT